MTIAFASIAAASVLWFVVTGLVICSRLSKKGYKINYVFIRLFLPLYVHQYKTLTSAETGSPGVLYYHWLISINIAWIFGIAAIISNY